MVLPKLRDFLDAFDVPWPVAGGVALGSGILIYLHDHDLKYLRQLPDWADTLLFVLFVYGAVVIVMKVLGWFAHANKQRLATLKRFRGINAALDSLNAEEREVLSCLVENNQRSFTTNLADSHVATLLQKGLLVRGEGSHSILDWPHTVPDEVWMHLVIRRHEFV